MNILPTDALVMGAQAALQAYTRASDAYALWAIAPPVAVWALGVAAALVLLEWVVSRRPRGR